MSRRARTVALARPTACNSSEASDQARKCRQESGKERFNDKDCGPDGKSFDEQMQIMKTGQGTP